VFEQETGNPLAARFLSNLIHVAQQVAQGYAQR